MVAAVVSTAVSATIGVATLCVAGLTGQLRLESEPIDVCDAANLSLETIRPTTVAKNIALLRRIRAHETKHGTSPTPAIAVTAYAGASARAEVMRAGFAAYVSKPAPPDDMLSAILQVIEQSRRPRVRPDA
jgi:CheY-like chemotaxis protein